MEIGFSVFKGIPVLPINSDTVVPTVPCDINYADISVRTEFAGSCCLHSLHPASLVYLIENTQWFAVTCKCLIWTE